MKKTLKLILALLRNGLILFILLEIGLGFFYSYREQQINIKNTEFKISSKAYKKLKPKVIREIYSELFNQDTQWEPFVHFRLKKFDGKHNNINESGIRETKLYSKNESSRKMNIFCFGGSTMFSSGARDEHTIPSELSKLLYKTFPDANIDITNFGCHGYNRSIENIQLQQELLKNNIPDLVIFYDGVNEIISANQNNKAGLPTNAINRKNEFQLGHLYSKKIDLILRTSNINKLVKHLNKKINSKHEFSKNNANKKLALDIANNYSRNLKITTGLAEIYKFKVINFLQPVIFTKQILSESEKTMSKKHHYLKKLYLDSYELICKNTVVNNSVNSFYDISNSFNDYNQTIFTDFCHTNELANALIAKEITSKIVSKNSLNISINSNQIILNNEN